MGILFGFLAAFFQSLSYLCTRLFNQRHKNDIGTLLGLSHVIMGAISIPLVTFLMPEPRPPFADYRKALMMTAGFYLLAQVFLFAALVKSEASRVSPLLGIKIIIIGLISVFFLQQSLNLSQWTAILLSVAAALLLSNSGIKLHLSTIVLIILACISYSIADLYIKVLVDHFGYLGVLHGAVLGTGLTYLLCGLAGGVYMLFRIRRVNRQTWLYSLPFALTWLCAMFFLFSCFALIGVVFGNIIQSTRGIMSIGMGYLLANVGFERLEPKTTRTALVRRAAAAILMTGSVALFYWS